MPLCDQSLGYKSVPRKVRSKTGGAEGAPQSGGWTSELSDLIIQERREAYQKARASVTRGRAKSEKRG